MPKRIKSMSFRMTPRGTIVRKEADDGFIDEILTSEWQVWNNTDDKQYPFCVMVPGLRLSGFYDIMHDWIKAQNIDIRIDHTINEFAFVTESDRTAFLILFRENDK